MVGEISRTSAVVLILLAGPCSALAQTIGPDEAVKPNGAVEQKLALTPAQERAIYNLVIQQRIKRPATEVPVAVGALVPPSADLTALPEQATAEAFSQGLKYAMVDGDLVLVDPIRMRVVGVIRDTVRP